MKNKNRSRQRGHTKIHTIEQAELCRKGLNMKIDFDYTCEEWAEVLVTEIASHLNIPDHEKYETELEGYDMDERAINIRYEYYLGKDEDYAEVFLRVRYWVDSEWPAFCVSYILYDENSERIEDGAYQLVYADGEGKCIPLE